MDIFQGVKNVFSRSKPFEIRNTGCKSKTLDPVWNESFSIKLRTSSPVDFQDSDDVLHVDVWNFLPDETLADKLKRINEVRDSKGLRQFISDAIGGGGPTSGNGPMHKLIGSIEIPLREIPASGLNKWWALEKFDNKVSFVSRLIKSMLGGHRFEKFEMF